MLLVLSKAYLMNPLSQKKNYNARLCMFEDNTWWAESEKPSYLSASCLCTWNTTLMGAKQREWKRLCCHYLLAVFNTSFTMEWMGLGVEGNYHTVLQQIHF